MDMVTLNIKKNSLTFDATRDIKDDNSITNGDITLTFGPMGVETLNGIPFTNELLWYNSSQGDALIFQYILIWNFKVMVLRLVFMSFDRIRLNLFRFRVVQRLKSSKDQMLNLPRSHGIHGQHKFIVYGGQMRAKVLLKSNGPSDLFP